MRHQLRTYRQLMHQQLSIAAADQFAPFHIMSNREMNVQFIGLDTCVNYMLLVKIWFDYGSSHLIFIFFSRSYRIE